MRSKSRLPIRVLLARLLVLGLLPVAVLSAWAVLNAVATQRQTTERSTLELSRALASVVSSELDATRQALAALGRSGTLRLGDVRSFYDEARAEVAAHPEWSAIVLTDGDGKLVFKTMLPFGSPESAVVDPDSLRRAIATQASSVGRLLQGRAEPAFAVRVPIVERGKVLYVLTAAVRPTRLVDVLKRQREPAGWVTAVFDSGYTRVARVIDGSSSIGGHALPEVVKLFDQRTDEGAGVTHTIEGAEVFTGFTRLKPDDWFVAVAAPTAALKRELLHSIGSYCAGIIGSMIVCLLLARRISSQIGDGVQRIRDEAIKLSEGGEVEPAHSEITELDDMGAALAAASQRLVDKSQIAEAAAQAATAASAAKDEFLAVLGHELRNPLAPMLTALHLFDLKSADATARERLIMRRQIEHMRRLVDDLLDVSRITRGKLEIRRDAVLLQTVVERAVETMEPAAKGRTSPIRVDTSVNPLWVVGEETRLVQAVSNLISNALRYGGDGDIDLSLEDREATARIVVRDQGTGMTVETLTRAFEPFFQAPQDSDRQMGGLGLGLAIVNSVVRLHGGQLRAGSAGLGQGSWFAIELPVTQAPTLKPRHATPGCSDRKGRVVVVDDNQDALETLAQALRAAGHHVDAFDSPFEALARIPGLDPDVVILDLGMPGMNGYQLAHALAQPDTGWRGPLVAMTGYGQHSDKQRAAQAGFRHHLTKPVDVITLLEVIQTLMAPKA